MNPWTIEGDVLSWKDMTDEVDYCKENTDGEEIQWEKSVTSTVRLEIMKLQKALLMKPLDASR